MLRFVLHFCSNIQTQLVRGLRQRRIDVELRHYPNKIEVGVSTALPPGLSMHQVLEMLTNTRRFNMSHDLRSYLLDMRDV